MLWTWDTLWITIFTIALAPCIVFLVRFLVALHQDHLIKIPSLRFFTPEPDLPEQPVLSGRTRLQGVAGGRKSVWVVRFRAPKVLCLPLLFLLLLRATPGKAQDAGPGTSAAGELGQAGQPVASVRQAAEQTVGAPSPLAAADQEQSKPAEPDAAAPEQKDAATKPLWQYGGFVDAAYLLDFNHPSNHLFRSRGTTFKVEYPILNMAGVYLRKPVSESSRWGIELTAHAGQDSKVFGFSATAPNFPGSEGLTHLGPTNVSYLAPVGKGLTIQGGIFSSFIGYDSLYAKDNFNYTRPWGADFTPYLMLGVNASYPFSEKVTGTVFVVNGYWHLANANAVPSSGGQLAWKITDRVTWKQTILFGPHQADTSFEFWRFISDSIVEWKVPNKTVALNFHVGTEKVAAPGEPRIHFASAQLPMRWNFKPRWAVALRPEFYWDPDGRLTTFPQTVKAVTTTLEYRVPYWRTNTILRLEHRYDDSRGSGGGFFRGGEVAPGVVGLTPSQHLLIFAVIVTYDSSFRH